MNDSRVLQRRSAAVAPCVAVAVAIGACTPPVTPGAPAAPAPVVLTDAGPNGHVAWTTPADNGSPITSYFVQLLKNGTVTASASVSPATTTWNTPFTIGVQGTFQALVQACNALGCSVHAASNIVGPPSAPTGVVLTNAGTHGHVTWSPPTFDGGGLGLTSHFVQLLKNGTVVASSVISGSATMWDTPFTIGTTGSWHVLVQAGTVQGFSPHASSNTVVIP